MAAVLIRVPPTFNTDRHFPTLRLRPWAHGGQGRAAEKGGLAYGRFAALERRRPWLVMVGRSFAFARWLLLGRESQQRGAMAMAGRHPPRRATPSFFLPHLLRRPPPFRGSIDGTSPGPRFKSGLQTQSRRPRLIELATLSVQSESNLDCQIRPLLLFLSRSPLPPSNVIPLP